jgi:hypothetical protein
MAHFKVGNGARFLLLPLPIGWLAKLLRLRHPTVALAEDADEERLDPVNPLPAVFPGVGGFVVGVLGRPLQRRSTSKNSSPNCSARSRNSGNTTVTKWSRSACMSRKVEEMKTRTCFSTAAMVSFISHLEHSGFAYPSADQSIGTPPRVAGTAPTAVGNPFLLRIPLRLQIAEGGTDEYAEGFFRSPPL